MTSIFQALNATLWYFEKDKANSPVKGNMNKESGTLLVRLYMYKDAGTPATATTQF